MFNWRNYILGEISLLHYSVVTVPPGGWAGGTLICSYVGSGHFLGGSKIKISIFLWIFRKINNFLGMKILLIFFWGHHKIELYLGVISMHFRVFS